MDNTLLQEVRERLDHLTQDTSGKSPSSLLASFKRTDAKTLMLSANREGMIYFASILISLADKGVENSHFHFDEHTVLDQADQDLVIRYSATP